MRATCLSKPRRIHPRPALRRRDAGLADPAKAGSAVFKGRQAARGGDGPCADPLEASEARSATGREGVRD
jgi:hypothetical protein